MIDLSSYAQTLNGKPVAVFGLGVSSVAAIRALLAADIQVTAWDDKEENRKEAKILGADIRDLTKIDLKGYAFLLLAPGVPYSFEPHPVVVNAQKAGIEVIGDLELLHRCGHHLKTIGITGTNGKSTTTALATHVLNECGIKAVMGGNIGKPVFDLELTAKDSVLVLEISSFQMDLCPTFRPNISVLLNITPDHLDRHGSMKSYIEAKAQILEGEGVSIIGVDDDFTQKLFERTFLAEKRKAIPVSVKIPVSEGLFVSNGALFENKKGEDRKIGPLEGIETLRGTHNYQNAAIVYAVARELGVEKNDVFSAFKTYPGLPHRQYLVSRKNKVVYINDSKGTNAEATARALSSYNNIYWIIGGLAKEGGLKGLEIFASRIKKAYVIGAAAVEFEFWLKKNNISFEQCGTLDVATKKAHEEAQQSDEDVTVLLSPACASWDQFKSFELRGNAFTEQVLELIGERS